MDCVYCTSFEISFADISAFFSLMVRRISASSSASLCAGVTALARALSPAARLSSDVFSLGGANWRMLLSSGSVGGAGPTAGSSVGTPPGASAGARSLCPSLAAEADTFLIPPFLHGHVLLLLVVHLPPLLRGALRGGVALLPAAFRAFRRGRAIAPGASGMTTPSSSTNAPRRSLTLAMIRSLPAFRVGGRRAPRDEMGRRDARATRRERAAGFTRPHSRGVPPPSPGRVPPRSPAREIVPGAVGIVVGAFRA